MLFARVVGNVVCTRKDEKLVGTKLLLVQPVDLSGAAKGTPLVDLLAANAEISKHVKRAELARMCDPANYLGLSGEMVDRVLAIENSKGG